MDDEADGAESNSTHLETSRGLQIDLRTVCRELHGLCFAFTLTRFTHSHLIEIHRALTETLAALRQQQQV